MLDKAITFGLCPHCGWPRQNEIETDDEGIVTMTLGCSNPDCDQTRIFVG